MENKWEKIIKKGDRTHFLLDIKSILMCMCICVSV